MRLGKSIVGAIVTATGVLLDPSAFAVLPHKVATVVTAVGGILTVLGLRHAISKNGSGQ